MYAIRSYYAITIFGTARSARDVAGGASVVTSAQLDEFGTTDVVRALRRVQVFL